MSIHRLAFITILLTYILIVFGGFVASTESGMGCGPEWPLCNGAVIPELSGETLIEFTHRLIGAVLAILVFTLFFRIKRTKAKTNDHKAANWMIGLFTLQVTLGAIIVILDLPIWVIITHLYIAMAFLTTVLWIWQSSKVQIHHERTSSEKTNHKSIVRHVNIALILLLLTLGFGGYIKHQHSHGEASDHEASSDNHEETSDHEASSDHHGEASDHESDNHHGINEHEQQSSVFDWFFQWDTLVPLPNNWKEIVEATHLTLAVAAALYILYLTFLAFRDGWGASMKKRFIWATTLVLSQVTIGLIMAYLDVALFWAVLHLAIGTTLLISVIETRIFLGLVKTSNMEINSGFDKGNVISK